MKRAGLTMFSLALLVAAPVRAQELKAEVIHWWTSGGESAAVKVFAEQFAKAGGTWVDFAIAGGNNARTAAINRTVGGNPPAAMQLNTGRQFDELVENNLLSDVESVAAAENWKSILPEAILKATTRQGKMYAVPVNIHGQNWVWYNKAVLAKIGGEEPKNWDEAFPLLDKAKAAGLIPMAFSGQKAWEILLFENVLLDKAGPAVWMEFYNKRNAEAVRSPQFRAAAESYARLRSYVDPGAPGRNWNDATALVIQGKALLQVMGDWAKGEFSNAQQTAGKDYGCTLFGSRGGGLVIGGDVFTFPKLKNAVLTPAQATLARVMLEPETQIRFAQKKGSIPIRLDVDGSSLDMCAQKAMRVVRDKLQQVPSSQILVSSALRGALEDVYSQLWNNPDMSVDSFVDKIAEVLRQDL